MSNTEKPSSSNSAELDYSPKALLEDFDRAMCLCNTNPKKAMGIAESMCAKYSEFPLAHFGRGSVLASYACSLNDEAKNKQKLLNNALESLQKSMSLCPTPGCSHLIASVLYEMANDDEGYAKVVQECERGLSMAIPSLTVKNETTNELQYLMEMAKAGQESKKQRSIMQNNMAVVRRRREFQVNVGSIDDSEISREEEKSNEEFVKRVGDFWRNLHYHLKCRVMEVKVADLEKLYLSEGLRNLRIVDIMKDAIQSYRKKKHWVTWSCCLCKKDENEWKYENWSSIEKHIDIQHFDNTPKVEGTFETHEVIGSFDHLELLYHTDDDEYTSGIFKFDLERLVGRIDSNPVVNNRFLTNWLRKNFDVNKALDSWEKGRVSRKFLGIKISEQVAIEMQETTSSSEPDMIVANIVALKQEAVNLSAYDYREFLVPLLKYSIQGSLDQEVAIVSAEADAAMARLLEELSLEKEDEPTTSKERKKKKGKQKAKGTGSREHKSEQGQNLVGDKYLEHETTGESHQEVLEGGLTHEKERVAEDKLEEPTM